MTDRVKDKLERFILGLIAPLDYFAPYVATVKGQNNDGTLELRPEDKRLGDFSKVPISYGIPDTKATFQSNARVVMAFENGDRRKPYVYAFSISRLGVLEIGSAGGTTQYVALENLVKSELQKLADTLQDHTTKINATWTALKSHTHAGVTAGVATSGNSPGLSAISDVSAPQSVGDVKAATVKVR